MTHAPATLYVVGTPIGNLDDITRRALQVLEQVDWVAAEDTRQSGVLLQHLGLRKRLLSCHANNERQASATLVAHLKHGESVALITDAGTPGISDPGGQLVQAASAAGIPVVPIPGPSAVTALISITGWSPGPFLFYGFLPPKPGARARALNALQAFPWTLVFYEAPHRMRETALAMVSCFGPQRRIVVGRELTKRFETVFRATLGEVEAWLEDDPNQLRGEFVLGLEGQPPLAGAGGVNPAAVEAVMEALLSHYPLTTCTRWLSQITGVDRQALYQQALQLQRSKLSRENY